MMSGAGGFSQADGMQQEHTNLTEEELEALKPQEIRVVNPWIHEHTHKEYLENITVSHPRLLKHNFFSTMISGLQLSDGLSPWRHFCASKFVSIEAGFLAGVDVLKFALRRVFHFFN
jgi:hypothetical protein